MNGALSQNVSQTTLLAPQLRESLRFLAMSLPELRSALIAEMARNPVIDDIEPTLEKTTLSEKERESAREGSPDDDERADDMIDAARLAGFRRPDDYVIGARYDGRTVPDEAALERRQKLFDSMTAEETLVEHLFAQLDAVALSEEDRTLAELIIGELDEDGRFVGDLNEILSVTGSSEARARVVLRTIRSFDPPGCGARTLAECLAAQLDSIADVALRARVAKLLTHLEDVAAARVDDPEALKALRSLDPRPGRAFGASSAREIKPEVHVTRCSDGYVARVDARSLPEIRFSQKYLALLADPNASDEAKAYVRERLAAAKAMIAAIEKRRMTIEQIAQEIVDRQGAFFEKGLAGLRPLTMQEVADAVGVHATTVSRTVNGKFMATPRGVVELRRFFVQGMTTTTGESVSRDGIIAALREIVDGEDAAHPLSDARLAEQLNARGFPVARRTVAKYRALAHIPGTTERRRPAAPRRPASIMV